MCTDRRDFLRLSAVAAGATFLGSSLFEAHAEPVQQANQPDAIRRLRRMTDGVVPISIDEHKARIEKARKLMRDNRIDALYIEPGSSMFYYTGMQWGTSERMFAMVLPAKGDIGWVCPKFEEERARELIKMGTDIRTWEEDQSPYER
jgi:Creatinase/Prolidase N-terminal domain